MNLKNSKFYKRNKLIISPLIATLIALIITFVGNLLVEGWNWSLSDFIIAGFLIFITSVIVEIVAIKIKNPNYRHIAIFLIIAALIWLWAELAVGIFTNWGN